LCTGLQPRGAGRLLEEIGLPLELGCLGTGLFCGFHCHVHGYGPDGFGAKFECGDAEDVGAPDPDVSVEGGHFVVWEIGVGILAGKMEREDGIVSRTLVCRQGGCSVAVTWFLSQRCVDVDISSLTSGIYQKMIRSVFHTVSTRVGIRAGDDMLQVYTLDEYTRPSKDTDAASILL
jgi:hypothetical protein